MTPPSVRLSKSRFASGLRCPKRLWWEVHEPDAPELTPGPALAARFEEGTRVGALARTYVPGGVLVDVPARDFEERLVRTRAAMESGARVIYEAAFSHDGVIAAADILERGADGFTIIEVKSATELRSEHVSDVGLQAHVLAGAGLAVARAEVMHLNRDCVYPRLEDLFVREDVTEPVEALMPTLPAQIADLRDMLAGPVPEQRIGPHCLAPHECPFRARCWAHLPEHHVSTLYYARAKFPEMEACGWRTVDQVPDDRPLHPVAARQCRAVRERRVVVEPGLAEALERLAPPLAFLDFETVGPAVPVWPGCRPYDHVPVQFSCLVERGGERVEHNWLAEGPVDPRPELADRLIEACRGAATILAYYAPFELRMLRGLAAAVPDRREELEAIESRVADLWALVRDHVYHPGFRGSLSLKSVLPALVPGAGYDDLEIRGGELASVLLARLLLEPGAFSDAERARLRRSLLRYCARDTSGTARLHDALWELAAIC